MGGFTVTVQMILVFQDFLTLITFICLVPSHVTLHFGGVFCAEVALLTLNH